MKINLSICWRVATSALILASLVSCSTPPAQQTQSGEPVVGAAPESFMDDVLAPLKKALPPMAPAPPVIDPENELAGGAMPEPERSRMAEAPMATMAAPTPIDPKKAEPPFLTQRVFYGTNRKVANKSDPNSFYGGSRSDKLEVGYCEVSIPLTHQEGKVEAPNPLSWQYWFAGEFQEDPKKHVVLLGVKPQDQAAFVRDLQAKMRTESVLRKRCFVFVHGFNVPFRNAARRTAQMAHDLGFPGAPIFFSWPSQGGETYYTLDAENNLRSRPELRNFLEMVAKDTGAQEIYLIAHSMGTRVTSQAVPDAYAQLSGAARSKIKAVILAAPDIDADVFNNDVVPQMQATGIPLTLYASRADKALQISKQFNGKARIGQDPLLAANGKKGIDVIDASSVKTDFTEHNYFGASPIMIRDLKAIFDGRKPEQRSWLQVQNAPSGGKYWVLPSP